MIVPDDCKAVLHYQITHWYRPADFSDSTKRAQSDTSVIVFMFGGFAHSYP
jgi:hypothetical protein